MSEQLAPCPSRPNCVCSQAGISARHHVEPFVVSGEPATAFERLKELLADTPRTVVLTATDTYLHAICRTRLGFIDDLECRLCPTDGAIHVRSASRTGYYDFGVNRARVEALRRRLRNG